MARYARRHYRQCFNPGQEIWSAPRRIRKNPNLACIAITVTVQFGPVAAEPGHDRKHKALLEEGCEGLANILRDCEDPLRAFATEPITREHSVNTDNDITMLADQEIVDMLARIAETSIGQLLSETAGRQRQEKLDLSDEDTSKFYRKRSERCDTVIDMRQTRPAKQPSHTRDRMSSSSKHEINIGEKMVMQGKSQTLGLSLTKGLV